ncbi:MAG: hypothetical protein QM766_19170 [Burkholderiaceae bacterium]
MTPRQLRMHLLLLASRAGKQSEAARPADPALDFAIRFVRDRIERRRRDDDDDVDTPDAVEGRPGRASDGIEWWLS